MAEPRPHTPEQTFLAAAALRKLKAGEPLHPKSCTREHFGNYYALVNDMREMLRDTLNNTEDAAAVVSEMEVYWSAARLEKRYRAIVDAVDTLDIGDAVQNLSPKSADTPITGPIIRHADEITEKPMQWLWYPYIPRNMLVMLDGDPGLGKGLMLVQVAANLSRGWPFLDQFGKPTLAADVEGPQATLILSAEDSLEYVMVPRLKRAGADLKQIHFLTGWLSDDGTEHGFDLQHLEILIQAIAQIKPVLVILDPLVAYLGDIDMHRSNATRPLMEDLKTVAERSTCTVLGVRHPSKLDQGGPLMYRGQGNMDIVGASRSALWVQQHPAHPETRTIMLHSKTNVGMHGRTVVFAREHGEFAWKGVSRLTEPMLTGKGPDPHAFLEAFFWLEEKMTPGHPYESSTIDKEAKAKEITEGTMKRARKMLGITAKRMGDTWYSILPPLRTTMTTLTTSSTSSTSPTSTPSVLSMGYGDSGQEVEGGQEGEEGQEVEVGVVVFQGAATAEGFTCDVCGGHRPAEFTPGRLVCLDCLGLPAEEASA